MVNTDSLSLCNFFHDYIIIQNIQFLDFNEKKTSKSKKNLNSQK